jgi:hypothetical protein
MGTCSDAADALRKETEPDGFRADITPGVEMRLAQIQRNRKKADRGGRERLEVLPMDPRDPAIVRAKELQRRERPQ